MHELTFADSARPAPVICLRLPLRPYSLGHELILLQTRNPFLCLSRVEFNALPAAQQISALVKAVLVCYRTHAEQSKPEKWLRLWQWLNRHTNYPLAIADFRNYLTSGRNLLPALSASDERDKEAYEIANAGEKMTAGRPMGSPMVANLIHFCIHDLNLTEAAALDQAFGYIGNLYFAQLESRGCLYIENHHEAAARAEMISKRAEVRTENELARAQWEAATTEDARRLAYEKNPRIGNLFAEEWYSAGNDAEKSAIEAKWGAVALAELEKAGIKPTSKGDLCPA